MIIGATCPGCDQRRESDISVFEFEKKLIFPDVGDSKAEHAKDLSIHADGISPKDVINFRLVHISHEMGYWLICLHHRSRDYDGRARQPR